MNDCVKYAEARRLMCGQMVGVEELYEINNILEKQYSTSDSSHIQLMLPKNLEYIPFSEEEISQKRNQYLLLLGISSFADGTPVTIRNLRRVFGMDPDVCEPCFYNQDWYEKEKFIDNPMEAGWFFIRKSVFEESRAVQPDNLILNYSFPTAIRCTYSFFVTWLSLGIKLWYHDFVWCNDVDHNGDRIYVGKYNDIDGVNKNGFSIHRHLSLRNCYGCID